MGFFSKVWKGIKKTVKRAARAVKKVAKKVAFAVPGGKALWKAGTKIGQGLMKGIGKITNALGPIGMFALNFVVPGIGGFIGSMFAAIPGASAVMSFATEMMGNIGLGGANVFGGGQFADSTLGKLGGMITEGVAKIVPESIKKLGTAMVEGFKNNFPDVSQKLGQLSDKVLGTGQTFTEKRVAGALGDAETALFKNAPGLPSGIVKDTIKDMARQELSDPSLIEQVKLFGDQTGISKVVKVGKNIKGIIDAANPAGVGAADASAPQQTAGPAIISPAASTASTPSRELPGALESVGGGNTFFDQLVAQSRGGFA